MLDGKENCPNCDEGFLTASKDGLTFYCRNCDRRFTRMPDGKWAEIEPDANYYQVKAVRSFAFSA